MNPTHLPALPAHAPPRGRHSPGSGTARQPAAAATDPADGWWNLLYRGWTLLLPSGARLDLTELERVCFLCLLHNPNRELLRDELVAARRGTNMHTLNVAICRLRGKVLQAGSRLPLHTVHGVGYAFLGNLRELSSA